jgi:hypothetical protein
MGDGAMLESGTFSCGDGGIGTWERAPLSPPGGGGR